jgi:hypothetical protein
MQSKLWLRHCSMCLVSGLVLGSIWWDTIEGNYQARISLFATAYVCVNLFIVDALEGECARMSCLGAVLAAINFPLCVVCSQVSSAGRRPSCGKRKLQR